MFLEKIDKLFANISRISKKGRALQWAQNYAIQHYKKIKVLNLDTRIYLESEPKGYEARNLNYEEAHEEHGRSNTSQANEENKDGRRIAKPTFYIQHIVAMKTEE